ncbi:MAG: DUF4430 domain-containing protein [Oscillospiraceae bacterium]
MRLTKGKLLAVLAVMVVLAGAFWFGGNAPGLQGWSAETSPAPTAAATTSLPPAESPETPPSPTPVETETPSPEATPTAPSETPEPTTESPALPSVSSSTPKPKSEAPTPSETPGMVINPETGKDQYLTDPVPEGKPLPVEPGDVTVSDTAYTCTLSVRCDTILNHLDWLTPEKTELVPEDGVIFAEATVTFYEGESVFNLLQREMKTAKIHMEFANTPIYNSAYIEGIHNLYEFDCGELSGWMYKVNGWFPNYGCSRYQLQDGDKVEWVYTCDLGKDVGDTYLGRS